MQDLLRFLYRSRAFLVFVALEAVCYLFIIQNSGYHNVAFYNSSNQFVGYVYNLRKNVLNYMKLRDINQDLAQENAELRQALSAKINAADFTEKGIYRNAYRINRFDFVPAKVINNSTSNYGNFITIDKGSDDLVEPGMAVVNQKGIVGIVKSVSSHYATLYSFLHTEMYVSSRVKSTSTFCTAQWDGQSADEAKLLYVPRHVDLQKGDTVETSGFNAIFPEGTYIGTISDFSISEEATFYDIRIHLGNDFKNLSYVYVVKNRLKEEKLGLENNL